MAVTIYDVAEYAGVGIATVSRVINGSPHVSMHTRQRVRAAIDDLNYHPGAAARSLVSGRTRTIGFVLCQSPDRIFADAFLPEVLRGAGDAVRQNGFRVLLHPVQDIAAPSAYIGLVREEHADGIILSGPRTDDQQLRHLKDEGFPVVLLGQLPGAGMPFVDVDNVRAARGAVQHLLCLGHRRVGMITNAPLVYTAARDRLAGYHQALAEAGIPFVQSLVGYGDFREESGHEAVESLLDLDDPPTAVFVASDLVAFGAMVAIRLRGLKIPDDVALVGFDDVRLADYVDPPLTTVQLPAYSLGYEAARLLTRLIVGETVDRTEILLQTELVVRQSCGATKHPRGGATPAS